MPTLDQNRRHWDSEHAWESDGDEWSATWGGPGLQWREAILPRIREFLPARHILEIAPGHGRWTQFLADQCDALTLVELSEQCPTVAGSASGSGPIYATTSTMAGRSEWWRTVQLTSRSASTRLSM